MSSYLDKTGLTSLWSKIKSSFVAQEDGNVAIEGSLTVDETNVLTAIETASMTASSLDTSEKIYLIGATSQEENPQTYSHDTVYVGTDGNLYSPILYEDDASLVEKYIRWNHARVGQCSTTAGDATWYKFADTKIKAINTDRTITFKVCTGYGDAITRVGILTAHIRSSATLGGFHSAQLVWEYASSGIDTDNFVLLYKSDEDNGVLYCELWVNCAVNYQSYHFTVLQECARTAFFNESQWNLYITLSDAGETSYTDGYTAITSTLNTLLNTASTSLEGSTTDYGTIEISNDIISLSSAAAMSGTGTGSVILNDYENNVASGTYSIAGGSYSTANGSGCIAIGYNAISSGTSSIAIGSQADATGSPAPCMALGFQSIASGIVSVAVGYAAKATAGTTIAFGMEAQASSPYQTVIGTYNVVDADSTYSFIIGNGKSTSSRSNLLTADWDNNITIAGDLIYNGETSLTESIEDSGWIKATLSAGSTALSSASLQYRTIGKQLYVKGSFTTSSSFSSGSSAYLVASLIGGDDTTISGTGSQHLVSTSIPCVVHMYNDGVTYLNFYFPTTVSSGTTIYFDLSGIID